VEGTAGLCAPEMELSYASESGDSATVKLFYFMKFEAFFVSCMESFIREIWL
jgi:hypothetical protein